MTAPDAQQGRCFCSCMATQHLPALFAAQQLPSAVIFKSAQPRTSCQPGQVPYLVIVQVASGLETEPLLLLPLLLLLPSAARGFSTSLIGSGNASFSGSGSTAATLLSTSASVSAQGQGAVHKHAALTMQTSYI